MVLAGLRRINPEQPDRVRRPVRERDHDRVAVDHLDDACAWRSVLTLQAEPPTEHGRDGKYGDGNHGT